MATKSRRASLVLTSIAVVMFSLFGKGYSFFHSSIKHGASSSYLLKVQSRRYLSSETTSDWHPDFSPYKKDFDSISEEQWDKLEELSLKLFDWNTKVNLVSRKDVEFLIPNHVIPCLSMSLIRNFKKGETVIDVGTGGGLPGLPLAIICPDAQFTLIDSNSKKMMVVNDMATSLGLKNVRVICCRAEKLTEKFDFLLGRAVSALPNFLSFSSHLIKEKSAASSTTIANTGITVSSGMLYLKGGDFSDELQEAGIKEHNLFAVSDTVPSVVSEKFVLYVPAKEIVDFQSRLVESLKIAGPGAPVKK